MIDHPGFTDENYKKRRGDIAVIAANYKGAIFFFYSSLSFHFTLFVQKPIVQNYFHVLIFN